MSVSVPVICSFFLLLLLLSFPAHMGNLAHMAERGSLSLTDKLSPIFCSEWV